MNSKRKKLLFVISRFLDGGIDTVLIQYLKALNSEEFEVTLAIALDMGDLEVYRDAVPECIKVVHLVPGDRFNRVKRRKITGEAKNFEKVIDEYFVNLWRKVLQRKALAPMAKEADAVIDFDAANYTLLNGLNDNTIGIYHFSLAENFRINERHTRRQIAGMADYKAIVMISDAMAEEGARLFPESAGKFRRIYNGFDFDEYRRKAKAKSEVSVASNPYFLSVTRLEESQKNVSSLLKAYAMLKQMPEVKSLEVALPQLRIIGKGKDEEQLRKIAHDLGLDNDVVFMGFCPNPAPWTAGSLGLVLSSRYEGLPTVLIEAQILERPVIASDCPTGPREILEGGKSGILVKPGDERAMAEAMLKVLKGEGTSEILKNARESVKRFEIGHTIESLKNLI